VRTLLGCDVVCTHAMTFDNEAMQKISAPLGASGTPGGGTQG